MRIISERELGNLLGSLTESVPRVVVSGNWATPMRALEIVDANLESYRLFMLGSRQPVSSRPGVRYETPFVGAGMRHSPRSTTSRCELSLVPAVCSRSPANPMSFSSTPQPREPARSRSASRSMSCLLPWR